MKRFAMLSTMLVAAVGALPAPMPLQAADAAIVQRCALPDGSVGYTDGNCAVYGAQAVPMDAELAARIEADRAYASSLAGDAYALDGNDDDHAASGHRAGAGAAPVAGRRSPASGCARSPTQLANDLESSIALGDVNRIAESYHFAGLSTSAGERVLDRLQRYAGRAVVENRYFGGVPGIVAAPSAPDGTAWAVGGAPAMMRLLLAGDDGHTAAVDFDVERYAGCYFVAFA